MKVTIESNESLSDALRVLGAMYDVTLVVSEEGTAAVAPATASSPTSAAEKVRVRKGRKKQAAVPAANVSNVEMRSWALKNGMTVSNRGRLPARVVAAYRDAHQS